MQGISVLCIQQDREASEGDQVCGQVRVARGGGHPRHPSHPQRPETVRRGRLWVSCRGWAFNGLFGLQRICQVRVKSKSGYLRKAYVKV